MAFTPRTETYVDLASLSDPFDFTVTKPTGTVNGDILFCWIASYHPSAIIDSVPSGWSLLGEYLANVDKYALYYKIAASEPASWDWSFTGSTKVRAVCSCYTGGDFNPSDPIDVVSNTAYRTDDTDCIAASMTVSAVNSPLVFWAGVYHTSEKTFTKPSVPSEDWVEDDDTWDADSDFTTEICSMIWSGSGATGDMDAILSASDIQKHAFAVALNPSGGAATYTKTVSMDALLRATDTEAISLDTLLKTIESKTIDLDTFLKALDTETISLDAIIKALGVSKTVALDAILRGTSEQTVDLDAILKGEATATVLLDILLGEIFLGTASVSLDTILFKALPPNRIYTIEIRDGDGDLLAILENAHGISYAQMINSPHSLTLDLPANDSKISNILLANECWLRDNQTDTIIRKFKLRHKMGMRI